MSVSPLAGKPAPRGILVDLRKLVTAYFTERPDPAVATQRVANGTIDAVNGNRVEAFRGRRERPWPSVN